MKKQLMKLISLILVIALLLPTVTEILPFYVAFAVEDTVEDYEAAMEQIAGLEDFDFDI